MAGLIERPKDLAVDASPCDAGAAGRPVPGHEGSASVNLSGRAVVTAWLVSIGVHSLAFLGMVLLVFPFTPQGEATPLPMVRTTVVGPVDGTSPVPTPSLTPVAAMDAPLSVEPRPVPRPFTDLSELARYSGVGTSSGPGTLSELTRTGGAGLAIIGIGGGADLTGEGFGGFRLPGGSGDGVEFFGLGGSARGVRHIVYVVDRSGSMTDTFMYARKELQRSISALHRSQKFHVVFFNSGPPLESPPARLVSAIDAHKQQLFEFTHTIVPRGNTNPEQAMQRALSLEPDVIYLLSDGIDFQADLIPKLDAWNKNRLTRIFTIAYLDQTSSKLLERIAREHSGEFKFVSENDLP